MTATRTPNEIYRAVTANPSTLIGVTKTKPMSFLDVVPENIEAQMGAIAANIAALREADFDGYYEENGSKVLVKVHKANKSVRDLNPIPTHEADVQALRYLQGMLLIVQHTTDMKKKAELAEAITIINQQYETRKNQLGASADLTHWLTDQYAQCLVEQLGIKEKKATKQLTMARDLAIMMDQNHPAICTVTETDEQVTIEKSTPYKVRETYYDDPELFGEIPKQHWFVHAKKTAGLSGGESWLDHFFTDPENVAAWKSNRVATPPSARWLPLPPNNQRVMVAVAPRSDDVAAMSFSQTEFMRTGVLTPYDIKKIPGVDHPRGEQKKVAKKILRELIEGMLEERIKQHKKMYGDLIANGEFDFFISYQTLLSPLFGEERFPHTNNNARFITMIKEVMKEIANDEALMSKYKTDYNVNLHVHHTNSAVNRNAHLSNEFSADDEVRWQKIRAFEEYKNRMIQGSLSYGKEGEHLRLNDLQDRMRGVGFNEELVADLVLREAACESLTKLLKNEPPYDKLRRYQRNIMLAALEHLSVGSQGYTMAGCKSARDRTGVFACAVKITQENPAAMQNWQVLEKGIVKSLRQGHAFRSMMYHSAIIKVSLVHKRFMKALPLGMQRKIKGLLQFAQKPPKYEVKSQLATAKVKTTVSDQASAYNRTKPLPPKPEVASANLSMIEAQELLEKAKAIDLTQASVNWRTKKQKTDLTLVTDPTLELRLIREAHIDTKSQLVKLDNGRLVRIFPSRDENVKANTDDFFALGIDSAQAALVILKHSVLLDESIDKKAWNDVLVAYDLFAKQMNKMHFEDDDSEEIKLGKLRQAEKEYLRFNGVLADILVEGKRYKNNKDAIHGIALARDILWSLNRKNEAVCTVRLDAVGNSGSLSFAKRIEFPSRSATDHKKETWFEQIESHHPWLNYFIDTHPSLLNLSLSPTQRGFPNPANAWDESSVLVQDGRVQQIIPGVRSGISSPYEVADKEEREHITNQNQQLLMSDARLAQYVKQHLSGWKGLLPGNELVIPVLHQTLVDPGSLRYIGDRSAHNPRKFIKEKAVANKKLAEALAKKKVYCLPETGEVLIDPVQIPPGYLPVRFSLKQTNNGVNIFEKITDKSEKDVKSAEDLIYFAKEKLNLFKHAYYANNDVNPAQYDEFSKVLGFLESSKPSNPRKMTSDEQAALNKLVQNLLENKYENTGVDQAAMRNLALLMLATTNLASFLSYTQKGNVLDVVRDGVALLSSKFKSEDMNDAVYKSCYERIIAELLGVRIGGCKSALDREQEVSELTNAMYRQFQAEHKIVGYHDSLEVKQQFLSKYVDTQHKHNMCEMITGSFGSSDQETQGQAYHQESRYEQQVSRMFNNSCRHMRAETCTLPLYKRLCEAGQRTLYTLFSPLRREDSTDSDTPKPVNPRTL